VAERVYVPGLGYVNPKEKTTRDPSRGIQGNPPSIPSARPRPPSGSLRGAPIPGVNPAPPTPVGGPRITYRPPTGVAYPLSGTGGFGGQRGYAFGQRLGYNPDRLERFPYGVQFRTQETAEGEFSKLDPAYQSHLNVLAKNPAHGTSASTGRALWERITKLAAESTALGRPQTPQEIAAEIAYNLGVSPLEGRDGSDPAAGGSRYFGRRYGYGGGGGGGGSSSVVLTDPTSARGLLMQTMQGVLGRDPDEGEYKAFLEALNEAERANPRTVEMEGNTAVQSGGIDPSMIAMEYVEGMEEFSSAEGQRVFAEFMKVLGA
jgi:hypothetical protein